MHDNMTWQEDAVQGQVCCEVLSQTHSSWPASMLASVMTLLGRLLIVSFSCSNSAPAFLGAAKGWVMVKARDSSNNDDGSALHGTPRLIVALFNLMDQPTTHMPKSESDIQQMFKTPHQRYTAFPDMCYLATLQRNKAHAHRHVNSCAKVSHASVATKAMHLLPPRPCIFKPYAFVHCRASAATSSKLDVS